jgi:hypothetical protein
VLDPAEIKLEGFGQSAIWEDLETGQTRYVDPVQARATYRSRIDEHLTQVRAAFDRATVERQLITTDEPLDRALLRFLHNRPVRARGSANRRRAHG